MKELFVQYSHYNIWANQTLLDVIHSLPEAQYDAEVASSFGTVYKTVLHMWDAESMWWQRMKLSERIVRPGAGNVGKMKDVADGLMQQSRQWKDWISNAQEHMLQHEFIYQNTKKESFKQPVYQVLLHLFNHGTYHRGQIVNMLRQLGVSTIPPTDFIVWSRKR
ncbi:MAG: DinB family protein [Chitinophagaceae bacterium]